MKQIELTSKLVLAIIGLTSVSAILVPTYAVPSIRSADIVNETILSEDIKNGQVNTVDLASGAIQLNVHRELADTTIDPGDFGGTSVDCPAGEILTGGGVTAGSGVRVTGSLPFDENTWAVTGVNEGSSQQDIRAHALCIDPSIP
jgi:hypothetical protein